MTTLLAPCGIDCAVCDAYIATQSQDAELKQKLVNGYKQHMGKDVTFAELDCDGCPSDGRKIGFCAMCGIRKCAEEKGYDTCAECEAFPCETGSFIWTSNSASKATLESLRQN